jgi:hypothetical protein
VVPTEGGEVEHPVGVQPDFEDANGYNLGQPAHEKHVTVLSVVCRFSTRSTRMRSFLPLRGPDVVRVAVVLSSHSQPHCGL